MFGICTLDGCDKAQWGLSMVNSYGSNCGSIFCLFAFHQGSARLFWGKICKWNHSMLYCLSLSCKMPLFPELARAKGSVGCCWPSPEGYKWLTAVYRAPASPADFSGPNNFLSSPSTEDDKNYQV